MDKRHLLLENKTSFSSPSSFYGGLPLPPSYLYTKKTPQVSVFSFPAPSPAFHGHLLGNAVNPKESEKVERTLSLALKGLREALQVYPLCTNPLLRLCRVANVLVPGTS